MSSGKVMRRIRYGVLAMMTGLAGTMCGCSWSKVWDAVQDGALSALQSATSNFVGSLFIDWNEIFQSTPNFQIPTL